jgi:glycosyltransferase involved in cell wall biosynthesis
MGGKVIEVIIPVKDRSEIMQCVRSLLQEVLITKIIVCDGGSTENECIKSLQALEKLDKVEVLRFPAWGFNKSRLINQGIIHSESDFLLISDADIIWNQAAVLSLLQKVSSNANIICCIQDVEESQPDTLALVRDRYSYEVRIEKDTAFVNIQLSSHSQKHNRPGCGLICAKKSTLLTLGGYKENFIGWGWEDQDLLIRALLFKIQIYTSGKVIHLSHSDEVRNKHNGNLTPIQTRNLNIITCLESLAVGVLQGDLPIEIHSQPKFKQIYIHSPNLYV